MTEPAFISVYLTAASEPEAQSLAHALVEARLAACVNVLPRLFSVYRWQGKVEQGGEVAMIAKTRAELFEPLRVKVRSLHSYDCPCIVAWPIVAGDKDYLDWLTAETSQDAK